MSVWFVIPSKRPVPEANACLVAWRDMGFYTAVLREHADGGTIADRQYDTACYQGWARSTNLLIAAVMAFDPEAQWFVGGGDDYWPDPNKRADEIAAECARHFGGMVDERALPNWCKTFGVMQPTGDRWSEGRCTTCGGGGWTVGFKLQRIECPDCGGKGRSAVIDRIAGSPWMGREFCRRMYHGSGPMYNGYYHNHADEELKCVAERLGIYWRRRDLTQTHKHWAREQPRTTEHTGLSGDVRNMPEWAAKINDPKHSDWDKSKALFAARKAAGFPGHEPLEI